MLLPQHTLDKLDFYTLEDRKTYLTKYYHDGFESVFTLHWKPTKIRKEYLWGTIVIDGYEHHPPKVIRLRWELGKEEGDRVQHKEPPDAVELRIQLKEWAKKTTKAE